MNAEFGEAVCRWPTACGEAVQCAMDGEIGIATDRRCEMAITLACESKVAVFLGPIHSPRKAAEHRIVHGMHFWASASHTQKSLQFKPTFERVDLKSQFRNKFG